MTHLSGKRFGAWRSGFNNGRKPRPRRMVASRIRGSLWTTGYAAPPEAATIGPSAMSSRAVTCPGAIGFDWIAIGLGGVSWLISWPRKKLIKQQLPIGR